MSTTVPPLAHLPEDRADVLRYSRLVRHSIRHALNTCNPSSPSPSPSPSSSSPSSSVRSGSLGNLRLRHALHRHCALRSKRLSTTSATASARLLSTFTDTSAIDTSATTTTATAASPITTSSSSSSSSSSKTLPRTARTRDEKSNSKSWFDLLPEDIVHRIVLFYFASSSSSASALLPVAETNRALRRAVPTVLSRRLVLDERTLCDIGRWATLFSSLSSRYDDKEITDFKRLEIHPRLRHFDMHRILPPLTQLLCDNSPTHVTVPSLAVLFQVLSAQLQRRSLSSSSRYQSQSLGRLQMQPLLRRQCQLRSLSVYIRDRVDICTLLRYDWFGIERLELQCMQSDDYEHESTRSTDPFGFAHHCALELVGMHFLSKGSSLSNSNCILRKAFPSVAHLSLRCLHPALACDVWPVVDAFLPMLHSLALDTPTSVPRVAIRPLRRLREVHLCNVKDALRAAQQIGNAVTKVTAFDKSFGVFQLNRLFKYCPCLTELRVTFDPTMAVEDEDLGEYVEEEDNDDDDGVEDNEYGQWEVAAAQAMMAVDMTEGGDDADDNSSPSPSPSPSPSRRQRHNQYAYSPTTIENDGDNNENNRVLDLPPGLRVLHLRYGYTDMDLGMVGTHGRGGMDVDVDMDIGINIFASNNNIPHSSSSLTLTDPRRYLHRHIFDADVLRHVDIQHLDELRLDLVRLPATDIQYLLARLPNLRVLGVSLDGQVVPPDRYVVQLCAAVQMHAGEKLRCVKVGVAVGGGSHGDCLVLSEESMAEVETAVRRTRDRKPGVDVTKLERAVARMFGRLSKSDWS